MARTIVLLVLVLALLCLLCISTGSLYFGQFLLLVLSSLFVTAVLKGFQRTE